MSTRTGSAVIGLIGIVALAAYAIACRASFSPDGKKVLFATADEGAKTISVLVHDMASGKTSEVFAIRPPEHGDFFLSAQWAADGKRAVLAWPEKRGDDRLQVLVLPVAGDGAARMHEVAMGDPLVALATAPPLLGSRLYLSGSGIHRLDLETAEVLSRKMDGETFISGAGGRLWFVNGEKTGAGKYRIGTIDPETLVPTTAIEVKDEEIGPFLAVDRSGERVAAVAKKGDRFAVLVIRGKEIESRIDLGKEDERGVPGNLVWSPDGKTVWAARASKAKGGEAATLGVLEVPIGGGAPRSIDIVEGRAEKNGPDSPVFFFQIDISPDGKTLAVPATAFAGVKEADQGLYLVDLGSPDRKVTKVPLPAPARKPAAKE